MATAKHKQYVASVIATADELARQHVTYTEQFVTRANEELYNLLSGMMSLCVEIQGNKLRDQIIKQMRKTLRDTYQVKTQANSNTSSIVVRYVVRTGRKTAHVYGRVIQTAIDDGITAEQLPSYIRDKGGIDAIRKKGVDAQAKDKDRAQWDEAIGKLCDGLLGDSVPPLGTVSFGDKRTRLGLLHDRTNFRYLICDEVSKLDGTGGLQVVGIAYPNADVENKILRDYLVAMAISAREDTGEFWQRCKSSNLDQDTLITWRKANGLATPSDIEMRLRSFGIELEPDVVEAIRKAETGRKQMDEDHARKMEELSQAMNAKRGYGDKAANHAQDKPVAAKLKRAA